MTYYTDENRFHRIDTDYIDPTTISVRFSEYMGGRYVDLGAPERWDKESFLMYLDEITEEEAEDE